MLKEKSFYLWEKQTELGHIGVKRVDQVLKDDNVIAQTYHRCVLSPGDDLDVKKIELDKFADANEVIAVAKSIHTPEVVAAYEATIAKSEEIIKVK